MIMLLAGLAGCGDGGVQEIKQWMDEARKETKVAVPKLSPPKQFIPFSYAGKNSIDPFNPTKLSVALARLKTNSSGALKPDLRAPPRST